LTDFKILDWFNREAFLEQAMEAGRVFAQLRAWRRLMQSGMAQDFSWTASARRYLELYQDIAHRHKTKI